MSAVMNSSNAELEVQMIETIGEDGQCVKVPKNPFLFTRSFPKKDDGSHEYCEHGKPPHIKEVRKSTTSIHVDYSKDRISFVSTKKI